MLAHLLSGLKSKHGHVERSQSFSCQAFFLNRNARNHSLRCNCCQGIKVFPSPPWTDGTLAYPKS